jgi:hypothetical protein
VERWLWILLIVVAAAVLTGAMTLAQGRRRRGRVVLVRDVRSGEQQR